MIELHGPSNEVFLLDEGKLDDRAWLAFIYGQCHGLSLAIQSRTGWPLVAMVDDNGTCGHFCVRRPDGKIIDVTGAHTSEEITSACADRCGISTLATYITSNLSMKYPSKLQVVIDDLLENVLHKSSLQYTGGEHGHTCGISQSPVRTEHLWSRRRRLAVARRQVRSLHSGNGPV